MNLYQYLIENYPWVENKKKWVSVDLSSLDEKVLDELWRMYEMTYKRDQIDNYTDIHQLIGKYQILWLIDVDHDNMPDAFIIYKKVPNNNFKIALLGSDRSDAGKKVLLDKLYELLKTSGWFIEASKRMEEILRSKRFKYLDDEDAIRMLIGKKGATMKYIGDGYYWRDLTNTTMQIKKRIYGLPNI